MVGAEAPAWLTNVCVDDVEETARRAVDAGGTLFDGPLDLPPAGRLAVLADPHAAPAFYEAVFGWQAEAFGPATMWRLPGYLGGEPQQPVPRDVVATMEPAQPGAAPEWAVDFWVADAETTARTAAERGGRVLVAPHNTDIGFRTSVLADPGGATSSISPATGARTVSRIQTSTFIGQPLGRCGAPPLCRRAMSLGLGPGHQL